MRVKEYILVSMEPEKNTTRNTLKYLALIVFAVLVVFVVSKISQLSVPQVVIDEVSVQPEQTAFTPTDGTYCYERIQVATPEAPYSSEEHVRLTIAGDSVTGTKEGTQTGPDMTNGFWGDLVGSRDGTNIEVVYSYTVEGSEGKELELYELGEGTLTRLRYVLHEEGDTLVPDRTEAPTRLVYTLETCR